MVNKYDLGLVAGNFFISEFQPCVLDFVEKLDDPSPQYVIKASEEADLPTYPDDADRAVNQQLEASTSQNPPENITMSI